MVDGPILDRSRTRLGAEEQGQFIGESRNRMTLDQREHPITSWWEVERHRLLIYSEVVRAPTMSAPGLKWGRASALSGHRTRHWAR